MVRQEIQDAHPEADRRSVSRQLWRQRHVRSSRHDYQGAESAPVEQTGTSLPRRRLTRRTRRVPDHDACAGGPSAPEPRSHQPNSDSSRCSAVRIPIRGASGLPISGGGRRTFLTGGASLCCTASINSCRRGMPAELARTLAWERSSSGSSIVVRICHKYAILKGRAQGLSRQHLKAVLQPATGERPATSALGVSSAEGGAQKLGLSSTPSFFIL
jgi:hypothetical protein